ncbi:unnamed protein product [Trichobilharzia regenti]|nr:unnamed protein product [Trichobilharzia regenti]
MYHFSQFAIELNEMEEGVAPTDSRFRPDQRLMEEGLWDQANDEKRRLEVKQRNKRHAWEKAVREGRCYLLFCFYYCLDCDKKKYLLMSGVLEGNCVVRTYLPEKASSSIHTYTGLCGIHYCVRTDCTTQCLRHLTGIRT